MLLQPARHRDGRAAQQGAVAVEFAIVMPVLLLLVFGIIQFGIVMAQQNSLNAAVRTGARYGSVNAYAGDHTCGSVVEKVQTAAQTIGINEGSDVTVAVEYGGVELCDEGSASAGDPPCLDGGASPGDSADLTVIAGYRSFFLVPMPFANDYIDLSSKGVFQCEYH